MFFRIFSKCRVSPSFLRKACYDTKLYEKGSFRCSILVCSILSRRVLEYMVRIRMPYRHRCNFLIRLHFPVHIRSLHKWFLHSGLIIQHVLFNLWRIQERSKFLHLYVGSGTFCKPECYTVTVISSGLEFTSVLSHRLSSI